MQKHYICTNMVTQQKINIWWANLTVPQKERIASKILSKSAMSEECRYPKCTAVWNTLDLEQQERIYQHCTDDHGYLLREWVDRPTYSE